MELPEPSATNWPPPRSARRRADGDRRFHHGELLQVDARRAEPAARPPEVVLDRDNFPTNRYVVESLARDLDLELVWLEPPADGGVTAEDVAAVIDERTAVVTLSHIAYQSGYLADAPAITEIAHQAGALVVWDLCHSVGSTEIELDAWDVDFAVGCTYKFVGAGPGAPALLYVNARHHGASTSRSGAGSAGGIRSRWSRDTFRRPASGRCCPAPRRAGHARGARGRSGDRRGRDRRPASAQSGTKPSR